MNGEEFITKLKEKYSVPTNAELARRLNYHPAYITTIQSAPNLKARRVINIMSRLFEANLEEKVDLIRPIVEFFPVECQGDGERSFIDLQKEDRKLLRKCLSQSVGIYSFYNSEVEIIYVGKSESNLWYEMKNAFNRSMNHYMRYGVTHPWGKYKNGEEEDLRKMHERQFHLYDAAKWFSAYAVPLEFINIFETFIIRLIPNDLLNVQMAGNSTLKPFVME